VTSAGLAVEGVGVQFGAVAALNDVSIAFPERERIGIIGPNGAGKSTLLNVVSGFLRPGEGAIRLEGRDITGASVQARVRMGIIRSFQTVRLLEEESVFVNVMLGRQRFERAGLAGQLLASPSTRAAERRGREVVDALLGDLELAPERDRPVKELPFAARRLVEVARVLAGEASVVLLDEPGAGLDEASRQALVETLVKTHAKYPSTLVVVEHDVDMIKRLCAHSVVLDHGVVIASGAPADVLADPAVREAYVGRVHAEA
jgi:branched-chain amino acid transport system ATP-binding protein